MKVVFSGDGGDEGAINVGGQCFDTARKMSEVAGNHVGGVGRASYVALMTALGGMTVAAALLSKRPEGVSEDSSEFEQTKAVVNMTNPETVLLAALIARHMFDEARHPGDTQIGIETTWGPGKIYEAMEDWKKLTGKDPKDYFLGAMIEAAEQAGANSTKPFDTFLETRRAQVAPGSGTAQ